MISSELAIKFAAGGWKLMFGVVFTNLIAGGIVMLIAKNRSRNTQMLIFLFVLFLLGGIVTVMTR